MIFYSRRAHLLTTLVVAKSVYLRFRPWRKLRTLPCSSSPHKAGFAGDPLGGGILPVGQARALCRGLSAVAGNTGYAAITICFYPIVSISDFPKHSAKNIYRIWLPDKTCHRQLLFSFE